MTLESFILHEYLGGGSYGKVLLVSHPASEEQLVLKLVEKRAIFESPVNNPLVERQVLEMVGTSPLFTHAFGAFQTKHDVFYAMEYRSGGTLKELIKRCAPLHIDTIRFLIAELLCGLEYLHSKGIIHRDMKPENIILDHNGHAKIADFGLAKTGIFGNKTAKKYVGTVPYMAPEIFHHQRYNGMVDYFALGIIAYEMATGEYPFKLTNSVRNRRQAICVQTPVIPQDINADLRDLINRLLCKDQAERQSQVSNLREHPFFKEVDWEERSAGRSSPPPALRTPPPKPSSKRVNPYLVFTPSYERFRITWWRQRLFRHFSFVSDRWRAMFYRK